MKATITTTAQYLPERSLSNQELEKMVDTTNEWILSRTGIENRHLVKEGEATSDMGTQIAKKLLEKSGKSPEEIDLILVATSTPDFPVVSTAALIQDKIGAINAWGYDIVAACTGFVYAMETGSKLVESGQYKCVIVIGSDTMSSIIDYEDRATCIIFGDGCGAVMLEPTDDGMGVQDFILHCDGSGREFLLQPGGGSANPPTQETVEKRMHYVKQEGKQVFKFAVTNMADVSAAIMEKNNLKSDDVDWLVPHQANLRIIDATANRMGLSKEKVMINIQKYGNTTAGTLPLCLWDYESQLKKGDNIVLSAFGGGFTWGAVYLKWAY